MALYYYFFGVRVFAKVVDASKVDVLKHREAYGEYNETYQYVYEFSDENGREYTGRMKKLFLSPGYEIGEEISIRYLRSNPNKSRIYQLSDWFQFEFITLIITIVLFYILLVK